VSDDGRLGIDAVSEHATSDAPPAPPPEYPAGLPRFNWGAFLMPPIWGVAHGQWAGVFFLPAWAFVDNVLRGESAFGGWTTILGWGMVVVTLGLQVGFALNADRVAWRKRRVDLTLEVYLRRQRYWALASAVMAVGMFAWIWAYISRYGTALPVR